MIIYKYRTLNQPKGSLNSRGKTNLKKVKQGNEIEIEIKISKQKLSQPYDNLPTLKTSLASKPAKRVSEFTRKKSTRDEEIIIELWERNELGLVPLARTTSALLVSLDAWEATRAYRATWALVLWWVCLALLAERLILEFRSWVFLVLHCAQRTQRSGVFERELGFMDLWEARKNCINHQPVVITEKRQTKIIIIIKNK